VSIRRTIGAGSFLVVAALGPAADAQAPAGGEAPASFDAEVEALPVFVEVQAPTALPLVVTAGYGYSGVKVNSQPQVVGEAGPVYAPIAGDLGLLGGLGALPETGLRIVPGLLVGLGPTVGLPPVPIDPRLVPQPDIPVFPAPPLPALSCFSYLPGAPNEASCGGASQNILGFDLGAAAGSTRSGGDPGDRASLFSEAAVRSAGLVPTGGNQLVPIRVGAIESAAESRVVDGRITGGATAAIGDIEVAGALRIGAIRTTVTAATAGTEGTAAVDRELCAVTGVDLLGVPLSVDGEGVHFADSEAAQQLINAFGLPGNPLSDLGASLDGLVDEAIGQGEEAANDLLAQLGIVLRTAGPEGFDPGAASGDLYFGGEPVASADGRTAHVEAACLELTYTIPVSGTTVRMLFGQARAQLTAAGPVSRAPAPSGASGSAAGSPSGTAGSSSGSDAPARPTTAAAAPPAAPRPADLAAPPAATAFETEGPAPIADLMDVYPAFALLVLASPLLAGAAHLTAHRRRGAT
jgi:hypothetical protein